MYLNECTNPYKFTLPRFDRSLANLCTTKIKSTLVHKKYINDPSRLSTNALELFTFLSYTKIAGSPCHISIWMRKICQKLHKRGGAVPVKETYNETLEAEKYVDYTSVRVADVLNYIILIND